MEEPICQSYLNDIEGTASLFMYSYSYILVIAATSLKYGFIFLTENYAGLRTMSKQIKFITRPIFLLSFIMYAVVPMLASWNLRGTLLPEEFDNIFTRGIYSDYNSSWFLDVGQIVYDTMVFNIAMTIVDFMVGWIKRYALRVYD